MSEETPRTDAEHAKTLTPAYEYEGAEHEAWEWARKLERELRATRRRVGIALDLIGTVNGEVDTFCLPVAIEELIEALARPKPLPSSEL
jgi:hypothetical protein